MRSGAITAFRALAAFQPRLPEPPGQVRLRRQAAACQRADNDISLTYLSVPATVSEGDRTRPERTTGGNDAFRRHMAAWRRGRRLAGQSRRPPSAWPRTGLRWPAWIPGRATGIRR